MTSPSNPDSSSPQEELDSILVKAITDFNIRDMGGMNDGRNARLSIKDAKSAINSLTLKQVLELIGEDEVRPESGPKRNGIDQGLRRTRNKLRAELRASAERIWS